MTTNPQDHSNHPHGRGEQAAWTKLHDKLHGKDYNPVTNPTLQSAEDFIVRLCKGNDVPLSDKQFKFADVCKMLNAFAAQKNAGLEKELNTAKRIYSSDGATHNATIVFDLMQLFAVEAGKAYSVVDKTKDLKAENERLKQECAAKQEIINQLNEGCIINHRNNRKLKDTVEQKNQQVNSLRQRVEAIERQLKTAALTQPTKEEPCTEEPK